MPASTEGRYNWRRFALGQGCLFSITGNYASSWERGACADALTPKWFVADWS